jgi:hypothetical protein
MSAKKGSSRTLNKDARRTRALRTTGRWPAEPVGRYRRKAEQEQILALRQMWRSGIAEGRATCGTRPIRPARPCPV